jgi:hypothetical protein
VLLIPLWRSAKFWPILAPEGRHFTNMVTRFLIFSPKMVVGKDVLSHTFKKRMPFVCFRINGEKDRPEEENLDFLACIERGCNDCVD